VVLWQHEHALFNVRADCRAVALLCSLAVRRGFFYWLVNYCVQRARSAVYSIWGGSVGTPAMLASIRTHERALPLCKNLHRACRVLLN
jgi:hypothetical protein